MVVLFLVFKGISILFSIVALSIYIPTQCKKFPSAPSPAFIVCRLKKNKLIYFNWRQTTLQCCSVFCQTLTWISHGCTRVSHSEPPSHLPPHPIPLGCPSALPLSALFDASNLDWRSASHMLIYIFQCYSLKSSHPHLLPQGPKVCSLYLFCCLAYRVIITIFLNSIYMH